MSTLKFFRIDIAITFIALAVMALYGGVQALITTAILIVLEIVFSFDNAGVNAKYLVKLSAFWRKMFLTVGILIAVFLMRLIFPFVIVCFSGKLGPLEAWNLAMEKGDVHTPGTYAYIIEHAHPFIAAFGGVFLLMLFLHFLIDSEKDSHWLSWIERPLARAGNFNALPVFITLASLGLITNYWVPKENQFSVLLAGVFGMLVFIATNSLATFMESKQEEHEESLEGVTVLVGRAAFSMFLFLEVLDASFSFDGVLGAFAITSNPIIIAIGLGVGAIYVRSMTIYLVERGTLQEYQFLEHGAHWAIGVLATMLLITIKYDIPDIVIGLTGIVFILASVVSSKRRKSVDPDEPSSLGIAVDHHSSAKA